MKEIPEFAYESIIRDLAVEVETLEPVMRNALLDVLKLASLTSSLYEMLKQLPVIEGPPLQLSEDLLGPRIWIHTALDTFESLPAEWRRDETTRALWAKIADCSSFCNTTAETMHRLVMSLLARLGSNLTSSAHQWAERFVEQRIETFEETYDSGGDERDGAEPEASITEPGIHTEETPPAPERGHPRRYQRRLVALCAAVALILIACGVVTHRAHEQAERADARAAEAMEEARQLREAPISLNVRKKNSALIKWWRGSDGDSLLVGDYTITIDRLVE